MFLCQCPLVSSTTIINYSMHFRLIRLYFLSSINMIFLSHSISFMVTGWRARYRRCSPAYRNWLWWFLQWRWGYSFKSMGTVALFFLYTLRCDRQTFCLQLRAIFTSHYMCSYSIPNINTDNIMWPTEHNISGGSTICALGAHILSSSSGPPFLLLSLLSSLSPSSFPLLSMEFLG